MAAAGEIGGKVVFDLARIDPARPVLIFGPTASGKSGLALRIAEVQGGVIVNADALQVYKGWEVLTAQPSPAELARAPHALYVFLAPDSPHSTGQWLRDVAPYLSGDARPIIVGGTGLNFLALTEGLAVIPATPPAIRAEADALTLETLIAALDAPTRAGLDLNNRARVQRAWEVQRATGRSIRDWQAETPPPLLPLNKPSALVLTPQVDWLNTRIATRFDQMLTQGALDEARAMAPTFDPAHPASKAIGAKDLIAHIRGDMTLDAARAAAITATRQYAKRQRTWTRARMGAWHPILLP